MLALRESCIGLVSRKDGYFTLPFPGYVSIGLLKIGLGYTWLYALLDMTAGGTVFLAFHKYNSPTKYC
jgi:hypothetical protein